MAIVIDKTEAPFLRMLVTGESGAGKSTFAMKAGDPKKGPTLVVDFDKRIRDVANVADNQVLSVFGEDEALGAELVKRICKDIEMDIKKHKPCLIVVDSLTPLFEKLINDADDSGKRGLAKYREKADTMQRLIQAVTNSKADVIFINHVRETISESYQRGERLTVSKTELRKLRAHLNAMVRIDARSDGDREVKVMWSRGNKGRTFVDSTGNFDGMFDRMNSYMWNNVNAEEAMKWNPDPDTSQWSSKEDAIQWGYESGFFKATNHAESSFNKLRSEHSPESLEEWFKMWVKKVNEKSEES